jgi:TusA-related sulfurtransferase
MYDFVPNRKPALMLKNGEMFKVYKNDIKSVKNIEEVITHTSPDIQKQHEQNKMQRSDTQQVQKS